MSADLHLDGDAGPNLLTRELVHGQVVLCGAADPTQANRPSEDRAAAWTRSTATVLSVADGAGGHAAGGQAAHLAIDAIAASMEGDGPDAIRHSVIDAYEQANRRVCAMGNGAATTLATAIIHGRKLRAMHVGDSAVLVIGGRGAIKLQTVAHSPVGYALEAGLLSEEEALHHGELNVISNVVGAADMRVEMHTPIRLRPRDTVVLATDGVLDNVEISELAELVRRGPVTEAAERLASRCHQRMIDPKNGEPSKPDDATFVLFRHRS